MFREMRRKNQALSEAESRALLQKATSGVLALSGDDGFPYAVPLSFVLDGDRILFHCAPEGEKIDAVARNEKASFCVIAADEILPEKFTTCYQSVIVFGRIHRLTKADEKRAALEKIAAKYSPDAAGREAEIDGALSRVCILSMNIEKLSGKEAIELYRRRSVC